MTSVSHPTHDKRKQASTVFMNLRDQCKDLKSMISDSHYDQYDEQNTDILSITYLSSCGSGGELR